ARAARQEAPAGSAIVEPVAAEEAADEVEFVHYFRVNSAAPRLSRYSIFTAEQARARYGPAPGPVWVTVRKTREVWLYHGVRVHLDDVDGLGAFLELEAPVTTPRPMSRCRALVAELRAALGPALGEPVTVSYSDLVASAPG
ncbi:MAG TPA: CYTH domain-containing protein, partial [Phycisphaerales bacterium]|nr:CYTH domain-containing protein [Phycisphaerales bacterium]